MYAQIISSVSVSGIVVLYILAAMFVLFIWRKEKYEHAENNCRYLILQAREQLRQNPDLREFRIPYGPDMKLDFVSETLTEGMLRWNKWIVYLYKESVTLRPVKPLDGAPTELEYVCENHRIWTPSAYINGFTPEFDSFEHLDKLTVGN